MDDFAKKYLFKYILKTLKHQLKALKVLLMHLFVTPLINKTTGSDNQHFFFNTLENENKEEFLTYSTFCTIEQVEKIYYGSDYPRMHYPKFI